MNTEQSALARAFEIVREADEACAHVDYPGACSSCLAAVIARELSAAAQPSPDVAGTSGESLAGLSKENEK